MTGPAETIAMWFATMMTCYGVPSNATCTFTVLDPPQPTVAGCHRVILEELDARGLRINQVAAWCGEWPVPLDTE